MTQEPKQRSPWIIFGIVSLLLAIIFLIVTSLSQSGAVEAHNATTTALASTLADVNAQLASANTQTANLSAARDSSQRDLQQIQIEVQLREGQEQLTSNPQMALELAVSSLRYFGDDPNLYLPASRTLLLDTLTFFSPHPTLLKHQGRVSGTTYNHDQTQLLSWSEDGTARIWNPASGEVLQIFRHQDRVLGAAWVHDDTQITTWSLDGTVRLWDAQTGRQEYQLLHSKPVHGAVWNADETRLLTWSDRSLYVWSADGSLEFTFQHADHVNGARWHDDNQLILSWSNDKTARVWDSTGGSEQLLLRHNAQVTNANWDSTSVRIFTWAAQTTFAWEAATGVEVFWNEVGYQSGTLSPDRSQLLVLPNNGTVRVLEALTGNELAAFEDPSKGNRNGLWSDDGRYLLAGLRQGTLIVDAQTGEITQTLLDDPSNVQTFARREDALITTEGGGIRLWDLTTGLWTDYIPYESFRATTRTIINQMGNQVISSAGSAILVWELADPNPAHISTLPINNRGYYDQFVWNRDESLIALPIENNVSIVDAETAEERFTLLHEDVVVQVQWSHAQNQLLTVTADSVVHVWDITTGEEQRVFPHEGGVNVVEWSQDDDLILTLASDKTLRLWSVETGVEQLSIFDEAGFTDAVWSPDAARILTLAENDSIHVWNVQTGQEEVVLEHGSLVSGARWNADSSHILSSSADNTARVWDITTGAEVLRLEHAGPVYNSQWNDDETLILTNAEDKTARMWNAATGEEIQRFEHGDIVRGARWNSDESLIMTHAANGIVHVWDAATGEERLHLAHPGSINTVVWKNDEQLIFTSASSSGRSFIRVWDAATGEHLLSFGDSNRIDWLMNSARIYREIDGAIQIYALPEVLSTSQLIELGQTYLSQHIPNQNRAVYYLPTLTPMPTSENVIPTLTVAVAQETVTPLPSLTPSVTPTPSITPTVMATATPQDGGQLRLGSAVQGSVPVGGREQWVFDAREGDVIMLEATALLPKRNGRVINQGGLDIFVTLYQPDGTVLTTADDINPGIITDARIEALTLPANGTYRIEISSFEPNIGGEYTLLLTNGLEETTAEPTAEITDTPAAPST